MKKEDISIVICCAGMGTRLGIGTTKALVNIDGIPLIIHQLKQLEAYDDIRIVVGYQAEKLIEVVNTQRKDIMFAFNYDYNRTGVAVSLSKGMIGSRKYTVYLDGDVLVNAEDFENLLNYDGECIAVSEKTSDEPICVEIDNNKVVHLNCSTNGVCWPGLAKIETKKLKTFHTHVYEMLEPLLPLEAIKVKSREIDTVDDYERAIVWFANGCK